MVAVVATSTTSSGGDRGEQGDMGQATTWARAMATSKSRDRRRGSLPGRHRKPRARNPKFVAMMASRTEWWSKPSGSAAESAGRPDAIHCNYLRGPYSL